MRSQPCAAAGPILAVSMMDDLAVIGERLPIVSAGRRRACKDCLDAEVLRPLRQHRPGLDHACNFFLRAP